MSLNQALWDFVDELPQAAHWPDAEPVLGYARTQFADHRPLAMPVAVATALSGDGDVAVPLGAAFALLYLASELLDDFQDRDTAGRLWSHWPLERALGATLCLHFLAQACLSRLRVEDSAKSDVIERWAEVGVLAAVGQNTAGSSESLSAYLHHVAAKSGVVFSAGAWGAARLVTAEEATIAAAREFGLAVGMLLQLGDDMDDYLGAKTPERAAGFLTTLPVVYARERGVLGELPSARNASAWDAGHFDAIRKRIDEAGGRAHAVGVMKVYEQKALSALARINGERIPYMAEYVIQTAGVE